MFELICMVYLIFMVYLFDLFILVNLMYLIMIFFFFNFNWLNWSMIMFNFSLNYYSNGLIIMMILIFSIIMMNLNMVYLKNYCSMMNLILLYLMYLIFCSMNFMLFYFMFESSLLLIFYMIMKWGYGEFRFNSSFYLMFYTLIFSLPLLYLLFNLLNLFNSLNFYILELLNINYMNNFKFVYMIMSFLVKIPMYMIHGWLLKAHVEAYFFSSMILASVMLKLGSYGILRIMYMMKFMFNKFYMYLMMINMFGMMFLSIMCLCQMDLKLIVAISSIIHMGIMLMSMLLMMKLSFYGSYYMMISHGFISSGLFYLINLIYYQTNSRLIFINKGMINIMPSLMMLWFMMCFCNVGSPFSLNLISEILLLMSLVYWMKYLFMILIIYCLLSFIYSMYLFSFIDHGKIFMNFKVFNCKIMNFLSLIMHLFPVNFMFFNLMI
uniref:NADH-ubiquinone oxidoreductase chain 4 n=1 Tax=Melipona scutellaris TaxID=263364 RepID=A0A0B4U3G3_9HYME|nr:NADH dehydrogenase subunit 4 [Melipona scutellaris]AJC00751.1 NADH dehydrogenase subunit 4 [Melipona scutellaris]